MNKDDDDDAPTVGCHDGCLVCNYVAAIEAPETDERFGPRGSAGGEASRALNAFFYGYAQALSHGTSGLAIHIDEACPKHKTVISDYVQRLMKFVTEHLAQGGEVDRKMTVN